MTTFETIITLLASTSVLPLLAFFALLLRRQVVTGRFKQVLLVVSLFGLLFVVGGEIYEHGSTLGLRDLFVGIIVSLLTFFFLSKSGHHHTHDMKASGVKGLVVAEAFHSLFDGLAIGATFLITPLLGAGAALGIFVHEIPKMFATLGILRAMGLSTKKTILYGALSQIGAPAAALLVYIFGIKLESEFRFADIAVIASLSTIVLYIVYLEIRHHYGKDVHRHH